MATTFEEIAEALKGTGLSNEAIQAMASYADFLLNGDEIRDELASGREATLEEMARALVGNASPEAIAFARNMADRALDELAKGLELTELKKLGESIARAVEEGLHPYEAARKLEGLNGLDPQRARTYENYLDYLDSIDPALPPEEWERRAEAMYKKLLRERARDIAHTEIRKATATANQSQAAERGAIAEAWSSEGGSRVCPICRKNEAEGIVEFGHRYSSGHTTPPAHPGGCRCTKLYLYTDDQVERFRPLMDARIAATTAAVESGVDPEQRPPV